MSRSRSESTITLPSINELFPEELLGISPTGAFAYSPTSATTQSSAASRSSFATLHSSSAGARLTYPHHFEPSNSTLNGADRARTAGGPYPSAYPLPSGAHVPSGSSCWPGGHCGPPGPTSPSLHTRSPGNAPQAVLPAQTVASSDDATVPPRIPSSGTPGSPTGDALASITKARPTFRVQLGAPAGVLSAAGPAAPAAPAPIPLGSRSGPAAYPPGYAANTYLSAGTGPGAIQTPESLTQQQMEGEEAPNDDRRHRCPHCNKRFNRPSSLNIHVNTHTGAKPFVCRFPGCNRTFNVNSNMRRHYRNHLNSRRRDAVAKLVRSPSPSSSASPDDPYTRALPAASPLSPYYSDPEDERRASHERTYEFARRGYEYRELQARESCVRGSDKARARSRSSPIPRPAPYAPGNPMEARAPPVLRCAVPGCDCNPVLLRPAFTERGASPPPSSPEDARSPEL